MPDVFNLDRIILRPFKESDLMDYHEYISDNNVTKYLGGHYKGDLDTVKKMLDININDNYVWAVELKDNGKVIGDCHFGNIVCDYLANIGYAFNRNYWGMGYAQEALEKIIQYGFDELDFGRIRAVVLFYNKKSNKLLEKLGFNKEALIYDYDFAGRIEDVFYYSKCKY